MTGDCHVRFSRRSGTSRERFRGEIPLYLLDLEAGIFTRPKQGIYEFESALNCSTEIAKEIFVESYNHNNTIKRTMNDYQHSDSYFLFID